MTYYLSPSFLARSTVATELENWFKEIINRCSTGVKSSNTLLSHFQMTIMRNIIFLITKAILFITELMSALYRKLSLIPSHYSNSTATDVLLFMAFTFLRESGSHPTRSWFEHRLHNLLPSSYGAHSMRAGGATFYASPGLNESIIQSLGRWSSSA